MSRLFNNKLVIIGMALFALYTVYSNIVTPLLSEQVIDSDRPDMYGFEEEIIETDESSHAVTPVNISVLFWDDRPLRDPYVQQVILKGQKVRTSRSLRKGGSDTVADVPVMTGFVAGEESRLAVVNNKVVSIGQRVDGYTVLDIDANGVHLVDRETRARMKLKLER